MKANVSLENYQEYVRQIGADNLPLMLQEGYRFCQEAAGYYHQDATVKEAIDLFLDRLSDHIAGGKHKKSTGSKLSSIELTLVRQFLAMHGKAKNQSQIKSYVASLQQAIRDKSIRKDSALAEDIALIQQKLIEQHNRLNEGESITITINDAWRQKLRKAVKDGKSDTLDGLDTTAIKQPLPAQPKKLSFLDPMDQMDEQPTRNTFRLPGNMGEFLGDLERFELAMTLEGDQGGGKTRFAYQLANAFASMRYRIAMFSLEIGRQSDLIRRMREAYLKPSHLSRIFITDQLPKGLASVREASKHFDVVVLDSWNKVGVPSQEFDRLRKDFPDTIFIVIFQRTTQKTIRGGTAPLFDAGINIEVVKVDDTFVKNYATTTKNRYGVAGRRYNISQQQLVGDSQADYDLQTTKDSPHHVPDD